MRISELVARLEEIEQNCSGSTREDISLLIDDLIRHDLEMAKLLKETTKGMMNQFKEDENFVKFLISEGIKSGSIGES